MWRFPVRWNICEIVLENPKTSLSILNELWWPLNKWAWNRLLSTFRWALSFRNSVHHKIDGSPQSGNYFNPWFVRSNEILETWAGRKALNKNKRLPIAGIHGCLNIQILLLGFLICFVSGFHQSFQKVTEQLTQASSFYSKPIFSWLHQLRSLGWRPGVLLHHHKNRLV